MELPKNKNHSTTLYENKLYVFGGYDGKKNHNVIKVFDIETYNWSTLEVEDYQPNGRNGHTATLIDEKIYIIGGWLGSGPFAADDLHEFDIKANKWSKLKPLGESPGPCNMHTADAIDRRIYVFRGGNGKDYLNDLHCLDVDEMCWKKVEASGEYPPQRANHSSAIIKQNLYIFGGWDGTKRLNDLFCLNTKTMSWVEIQVEGSIPSPRAGMSLTNLKDKLLLFGGSGHSAMCYDDLRIYDPETNQWSSKDVIFKKTHKSPQARAGHSTNLAGSRLFIIGGSYGPTYLQDVSIIDTNPPPKIEIKNNTKETLLDNLRAKINDPEYSDITFIVEGRKFFAHKIVLSLISEHFHCMFCSGMKESKTSEIVIDDVSFPIFSSIMHFLYTGEFEFGAEMEGQEHSLDHLHEFLRFSDRYMLSEVKMY
jgi:N-acetylneuraminic acid mutarotase